MTRLVKKFTDVVEEVRIELDASFDITQEKIDAMRARVDGNGHKFPLGSNMEDIDTLYLDYEVQRAAIAKHILNIMKAYDPRICTPASASKVDGEEHTTLYDGQQRSVATALLGFSQVPATVVETDDPAFPSYAFEMLNEKGIAKLTPGDLHRNALTRFRLKSREPQNVAARKLQDQFDLNDIDLEDKRTRNSNRRGPNDYFFSHFNYAYKAIELDKSGDTVNDILNAIKTVFPLQDEIAQGAFVGLYELARLDWNQKELQDDWMIQVLQLVKKSFNSSYLVTEKARYQNAHAYPGSKPNGASLMSNFLREVYIMNGGTLNLPYHGEGATAQIATNPAPGLFPKQVV